MSSSPKGPRRTTISTTSVTTNPVGARRVGKSPPPANSPRQRRAGRSLAFLAAIVACAAAIGYLLALSRSLFHEENTSLWDFQETTFWLQRLGLLVAKPPLLLVAFVPVGALIFQFVADLAKANTSRFARLGIALAACLALAWLVRGFEIGDPWRAPGVLSLVAPALGSLLGLWLGSGIVRGKKVFWRRVAMLFGGLAILGLLAWGLVWAMLDDEPLAIAPSEVSSAQKRALVERFQTRQRFELGGEAMERLQLSESEINQALAIGLRLGDRRRQAEVRLAGDGAAARVTLPLPESIAANRYLNVEAAGDARIEAGKLSLSLASARIGGVAIPGPIASLIADVAASAMQNDYDMRKAIAAVHRAEVDVRGFTLEFKRSAVEGQLSASLAGRFGVAPALAAATKEHYLNLLAASERLPRNRDRRFELMVQAAFAFAKERSQGGDEIKENKAAILSLGVVLGHSRLETFIGPLATPEEREFALGLPSKASLRQRVDWSRHFLLSAAIALLSAEDVSNAVGLFKEEYDAGPEGSGFSFGDLLADRAGVALAACATRNRASAKRVQEALSKDFDIAAIMPEGADLPEGLSEQELIDRYGGTGGAGYLKLLAEIDRRIKTCELLGAAR